MITHDRTQNLAALRGAVPYLRLFKGRTFVLKLGGAALDHSESMGHLLEQVGILHHLGIHVLVVHGGGPQTDRWSTALGLEPERVLGRRVTDAKTLDVSSMVLCGLLGTRIVARMRALGISGVAIRGVDAGTIVAHRRPPRKIGDQIVDYGLVGDIRSVDPTFLRQLFSHGVVPVLSPISATAGRAGVEPQCRWCGLAARRCVGGDQTRRRHRRTGNPRRSRTRGFADLF